MKLVQTIKNFMKSSVLVNWDNLTKCTLVMVIGAAIYLLWTIWYAFVLSMPTLKYWMNESLFPKHLIINIVIFLLFIVFAGISVSWKAKKWMQIYFPYFAVSFFGATFIFAGFYVGILSPVTVSGYISLISVGIVLFERKIIYSVAIPITLIILVGVILSGMEKIPYAPLFSRELNSSILTENQFWIYSMLYLYLPILLVTIILFEILLTQWRNREAQIQIMSQLDPLTGIFNRRCIGNSLNTMDMSHESYALILLDLDHFKNINDTYGHDVGDRVLCHVAKLLNTNLREHDLVGRFGGEEFVLLLKEKQLENAVEIAERCRKRIEQSQITFDQQIIVQVTASLGVAVSRDGVNKEDVFKQADQALYLAKKNGRNQVRSYSLDVL